MYIKLLGIFVEILCFILFYIYYQNIFIIANLLVFFSDEARFHFLGGVNK